METAPRSLDQLFNTLKIDVNDLDDLEGFISRQTWIKKFNDFLENRQLDDHVQTLKFLISLKVLDNLQAKQTKMKTKIQDSKAQVCRQILQKFFSEDNYILPLSDEKLQETLLNFDSQTFEEKHVKVLKEVKKDPTVWHEGLEPIFMKFLSTTSPSFIACLLSIL